MPTETKPCRICGEPYTGDKRSLICKKPECYKARLRQYAEKKKPAVEAAQAVPRLPRAGEALCHAVKTALGTRGVWKHGSFLVLDYGSQGGYQAYVPTAENRFDTPLSRQSFEDKIVLTARLNAQKRWELRPTK